MTNDMPEPPSHLTFYHSVEFAPGRRTAGWPVIVPIVEMIIDAMGRLDFRGRRVLDIGCRDGALVFEAERLGATAVIGIDVDLPAENIAFLSVALRSKARFERHSLYGLKPESSLSSALPVLGTAAGARSACRRWYPAGRDGDLCRCQYAAVVALSDGRR